MFCGLLPPTYFGLQVYIIIIIMIYDMIYLLPVIGLSPGGSSTVHI